MILLVLVPFAFVYAFGTPYAPPPNDLPDIPDFDEPPDVWDIPFPTPDLPDPTEIDFPEPPFPDPLVDPIDIPEPPPFPDLDDPFPDLPSLGSGEQLGYVSNPGSTTPFAGIRPRDAVANIVTKLMPFPARLPLPPFPNPQNTGIRRKRVCRAATATKIIVPESRRNTVAFIDTCPYKLTKRVIVGNIPLAVAGTPDGFRALVANGDPGTISVLDLITQTVTKTIQLSAFNGFIPTPNVIAMAPDGSRAYVANHDANPGSVVYILDLATLTEVGKIPVNGFPSSLAVSPDGSQLWVACRGDSTLQVFDIATNTQITSFFVQLITGIAFNPAGTSVYAAIGASPGAIQVIDAVKLSAGVQIPVGNLPHAVAVTPTGRYVLVTNALSGSISQIDTVTNRVVRNIPVGRHPYGIVFLNKER